MSITIKLKYVQMSQSHRIKAFGPEFRFSKNLWKVLVLPRARLIPDLTETFVFKLGKKAITFKFSINSGKINSVTERRFKGYLEKR